MPVITAHSPADIVRHALIGLGLGTDPADGAAWPIFCGDEPDVPDSAITVYDTEGRLFGCLQVTGEMSEHHGVQIRVRGATHPLAAAKAFLIAATVDSRDAYREVVTLGGTDYCVHAINRASGPIGLGRQSPETNRTLFVINATAWVVELD